MNIIKFKHTLFPIAIIPLFVVPAQALLEGNPELLRITADAIKENRDKIESWQGQSQVEIIREDVNGVRLREISLYDFAFSRELDATKWKWTGQDRYIREGMSEDGRLILRNWGSVNTTTEMRKGDAFYVCAPYHTTSEGERKNTLVIWPRDKSDEGMYSYSFDPMWYLTGDITTGSDDLMEWLLSYYSKVKDSHDPTEIKYKIEQDNNLIVFETNIDIHNSFNQYKFDLSKGGYLVECLHRGLYESEQRLWNYEQKDGVWIPETFTLVYDKLNLPNIADRRKVTRKVTFLENTLNENIPAEEFSIKAFGIYDGMQISEHRIGRAGALIYRQEGGEQLLEELEKTGKDLLLPEYAESLVGKSLPELKNLGINFKLSYDKKMILVCFFDYEQRLSRNCIMQLNAKSQELKSQDVEIVAIQVSQIEQDILDEWIKENEIAFPVGMINADPSTSLGTSEEQTRFNWGVKSLPWLILTDTEHIVTAEGFSIAELNEKIESD